MTSAIVVVAIMVDVARAVEVTSVVAVVRAVEVCRVVAVIRVVVVKVSALLSCSAEG